MKNKIILAVIFLTGVFLFSTAFVDYESSYIPKNRPFGTSFYWGDSTGYIVFSKGIYMQDSLKVAKDLYVGVKGGKIYMDTSRGVSVYVDESDLYIKNSKTINPTMNLVIGHNGLSFSPASLNINTLHTTLASVDSIHGLQINHGGLSVTSGNIQFTGGTQQIKLPSDTASDYDGNNSITLNRQSGFLTTKALTTTGNSYYNLTLVNSLITANTKIIPTIIYGGGTNTVTNVQVHHVVYSEGNIIIGIFNGNGSSLNGTIQLSYVIFN